jgi:hypothetical protein
MTVDGHDLAQMSPSHTGREGAFSPGLEKDLGTYKAQPGLKQRDAPTPKVPGEEPGPKGSL